MLLGFTVISQSDQSCYEFANLQKIDGHFRHQLYQNQILDMEFLKFLKTTAKIFDSIVQRWTALSYWCVAQRAKFAEKVHKPPLGLILLILN